jgi:kynureninase
MVPPPPEILARDAADPLAAVRERFHLPDGLIYLDGNSLGPAPVAVFSELQRAIADEWAVDLIASWNTAGWFALPRTLGARLAPLIGAGDDEVLVCDTVSINLYKCLHAALALQPDRHVLVAEQAGFPTDLYIASGVAAARPGLVTRLQGRDGETLEELIDGDTAVVLVNQVDYRTGALRDMAALTECAHAAGAVILWDLCHSAGIMPIALSDCSADFAVGCTYKYLNGGPGAPGFLYAARAHHGDLVQPLTGWWSHAEPFAFASGYTPAAGIAAMLTGTQPILSMRALVAALDAFEGVDLAVVRQKSMALTDLFVALVEERCAGHGLKLAAPRDAEQRGSQVSFRHAKGYAIVRAMIDRGVVGDFRAPDILRFGFAPLYIGFADVWNAVEVMRKVMETGAWETPAYANRPAVT